MKLSQTQSDFMNLIRWVAAWLVVAEHVRSLMFVDFQGSSLGTGGKLFYFLTGFGHEAIMIFFVMSGFLEGGKVYDQFRQQTFSWRRYLPDRACRLLVVLLPALVLGGILDGLGSRFLNVGGVYDHTMPDLAAVVTVSFVDRLTPGIFLGNLGFLQEVLVPPFGSNGPLWTLSYFWWYYVLFPCVLAIALGRGWTRGWAVMATGLLVFLLPERMLVLFGVWLLGVLVAKKAPPLPWWLAGIVCAGVFALARLELFPFRYTAHFAMGLAFAVFLGSLQRMEVRLPGWRISKKLAGFSYTVYVAHFPLLVFGLSGLYAVSGRGLRMPFDLVGFVAFVAVMVLLISLCWVFSLLTEAHTEKVRGFLPGRRRAP